MKEPPVDCKAETVAECNILGCLKHWAGLHQYTSDPEAYAAALSRCKQVRLVVLTKDDLPSLETACDGSMTCPCRECSHHRATKQAADVPQPWAPKPARHRRAA